MKAYAVARSIFGFNFNLSLVSQEESEVVTISGYHDVPQNSEENLLKALANQPLSVAIDASGRDFQFYSGVGQHSPQNSYMPFQFEW